jgi:hypothetical protein
MRMSAALVDRTLGQFEAQALPETHPAVSELRKIFGNHTFFVDRDGLNIVESTEADDGSQIGQVVKLASWKDAKRTSLTPHEPEPTEVLVDLGSGKADEPDGLNGSDSTG